MLLLADVLNVLNVINVLNVMNVLNVLILHQCIQGRAGKIIKVFNEELY